MADGEPGNIDELLKLDPAEFEHLVADIWERRGWHTQVTKQSGDKGVDVIARRYEPIEETHVIQAKRYDPNSSKVEPSDVREYRSLIELEDADAVTIVTTSSFTKSARELAEALDVNLIGGEQLEALINANPDEQVPIRPPQPDAHVVIGDNRGGILDLLIGLVDAMEIAIDLTILGLQAAVYLLVLAIVVWFGWILLTALFEVFVSLPG